MKKYLTNIEMLKQKWDVIIIGGGLAGLTAANLLTRRNLKILVLEKNKSLGGNAHTNVTKGSYFNLGPHALYKKGEGMKILRQLDISVKGKSPSIHGKLTYQGEIYNLPISPIAMIKNNFITWPEKKELIRTIRKILSMHVPSMEEESLYGWVEKNIRYEKIKQLLYALCRLSTYSHAPKQMSAKAAIKQLKISMGGALYVDGGWQTIINQLARKVEDAGVHIAPNTVVQEISGAFPNIKLKLTNGSEIETATLISTSAPEDTAKMVKETPCSKLMHWSNKSIPIKGASLDIHLKELPNPKLHFALSLDQALYFSNHSKAAKLTEHPKHVVIHVFKYHSPSYQGDNSENSTRQELEDFLHIFQPYWQQYVINSRYLPNITVSSRLQTPRTEQYMEEHVTNIPGFFIAGEWTTSQAMLADAAILSAKNVVAKVLQLHERT